MEGGAGGEAVPAEPEPEKTWLQKYWIYTLPVVMLVSSGCRVYVLDMFVVVLASIGFRVQVRDVHAARRRAGEIRPSCRLDQWSGHRLRLEIGFRNGPRNPCSPALSV